VVLLGKVDRHCRRRRTFTCPNYTVEKVRAPAITKTTLLGTCHRLFMRSYALQFGGRDQGRPCSRDNQPKPRLQRAFVDSEASAGTYAKIAVIGSHNGIAVL
ncbi:MAG: hypothetical protein M3Y27_12660, partial [Acidobacteriota bacterium]|nr:hypothetical protein [Acidobacteriota bacterium]